MKKKFILLLATLISVTSFAQKERTYIRQGNEYYALAKADTSKVDTLTYQKAEECYRQAIEKNPNSIEATYDLGNALYKQNKFEDALTQYSILENKELSKDSAATLFHNMGNAYLSSGKFDESIESYKQALKNNPKDKETKYNLAVAQNMKKKQDQQQKQQNKDNKDNKNNKDKKDQDKENQDKQNKDKKDQDKKNEEQKKKEQEQKDKEKKEQEKKQAEQKDKKDEISKEDAARMLEALQNDEKELQQKLNKKKAKAKKVKVEKDW